MGKNHRFGMELYDFFGHASTAAAATAAAAVSSICYDLVAIKRPVTSSWQSPSRGGGVQYYFVSFCSLYSTESVRASQEASMMFSETPTVPQIEVLSRDSIITRTRAAVPALALTTRTL